MRALFAAVLALGCLLPLSARGNGGPIAGGVTGTGDGTLLGKNPRTSVSIEEEDLTIDLHQEFAEVRLRYSMRNAGGAVEQAFFYPVESWGGNVERYTVHADGEALEDTFVDAKGEPFNSGKAPAGEPDNWTGPPKAVQWWRKSTIAFAAGQRREVTIRYRSAYAQSGFSISDDTHMEPLFFAYRLSPAAAWKDPIGRGRVTVNLQLPEPENVEIVRPAGRFHQVSRTRWEWNFRDLRPTQADDLRIETAPGYHWYPAGSTETKEGRIDTSFYRIVGSRAFHEHADYEAAASSTRAPGKDGQTYGVENLRPQSGEAGTWAEGAEGDGIGESLTLTVRRPLPLAALLIRPGFYRRENNVQWFRNNRVAACEITLNGEHTFRADIPNERFANLYPIPVRGYSKPVRTVKLTILAVHRGTETRDTCISLLILRAKLSKSPKARAVR